MTSIDLLEDSILVATSSYMTATMELSGTTAAVGIHIDRLRGRVDRHRGHLADDHRVDRAGSRR